MGYPKELMVMNVWSVVAVVGKVGMHPGMGFCFLFLLLGMWVTFRPVTIFFFTVGFGGSGFLLPYPRS